jgi:hypothetical protein
MATVNIIASRELQRFWFSKEYGCIRQLYEDLKGLGFSECAFTIPHKTASGAHITTREEVAAFYYADYLNVDLCAACHHSELCGHDNPADRDARLNYIVSKGYLAKHTLSENEEEEANAII